MKKILSNLYKKQERSDVVVLLKYI